jgi:signal recognition particle subunit SRP54
MAMLENLSNTFSDIVRNVAGKASISEKNVQEAVEQIKVALLDADVNLRVVRRFINQTLQEATGERVLRAVNPGQQFVKIVYDKMVALLGDSKQDLALKGPDTASVILLYGLQGSGKTTTAGKLGLRLKKQGRRVLLVAADLVRPAAVEQLAILGKQLDIEVYREEGAKDPVKVAKNGISHGKKFLFDTIIVDTSGRMAVDEDLMKELVKVRDAADPVESVFVADSMTGQHAVEIAQAFDAALGISGIILTKFDSDTRGGAALSLKSITGKPIKFIGTGEKSEDLEPFHPERIASRILGMGDIVSLVEKAQETVSQEDALKLQQKMSSGEFTLEDYLEQFRQVKKMGSLQKIAEMIPGMKSEDIEQAVNDKAMKSEEAIILSMTPSERRNHLIIGPSRRKRIAHGSGTSVHAVNQLIKKFEKMRLTMKKVTKNKKMQGQLMQQLGMR